MKRFLLSLALLFSFATPLLALSGSAFAVDVNPQCADAKFQNTSVCKGVQAQTTQSPIVRVIDIIINVLSYVIGVAAVIGIIISSLKLMLSNGDSNGIASARKSIIYCLIGLAIVAVAQTLVAFVLNKL